MQQNDKKKCYGKQNNPPIMRSFTPKATPPCLEEARQKTEPNARIRWVGNCGCTCLCPNPPS